MTKLPDKSLPPLGSTVEINHLTGPLRGMVVGRSFDSPSHAVLDIALGGGIIARNVPVNPSLRILES